MPVLESPEVHVTTTASGLVKLFQKKSPALHGEAYETDVGVNDAAGLNVLCDTIHISHAPVQGDYSSNIQMSLFLSEDWAQKSEFVARMAQDHNIKVSEEQMPWGNTLTKLAVTGQGNIQKFGKHLRESFAETAHEGASIIRQIVNPALLGTAIDHMNDIVAKSQEPKATSGPTWATMAWNNGAASKNDYGWQP